MTDGIYVASIGISQDGRLASLIIEPNQSSQQLIGFLKRLHDKKVLPLEDLIDYFYILINGTGIAQVMVGTNESQDESRKCCRISLNQEDAGNFANTLSNVGLENIKAGNYAKVYRNDVLVDYTPQIREFLKFFVDKYS